MDEESKELAKIVAETTLAPVTDAVATIFGVAGLDWLKEIQRRNQAKFADRTKEILEKRNVTDAKPPPPAILLPLFSAAQDEHREELVNLWAKLMAAASDPKRIGSFRRDFIEIAKQLDPIDAAAFETGAGMQGGYEGGREKFVMDKLKLTKDQITVTFSKLKSLGLLGDPGMANLAPELTALGREFFRTIMN